MTREPVSGLRGTESTGSPDIGTRDPNSSSSSQVSDSKRSEEVRPLAARVHALIAEMHANKQHSYSTPQWRVATDHWRERLEAALAAALAPKAEKTDKQVDFFVGRLELLLYRRTGNTWEANQLRAVRALFHDAIAPAVLAPQSGEDA